MRRGVIAYFWDNLVVLSRNIGYVLESRVGKGLEHTTRYLQIHGREKKKINGGTNGLW